MGGERMVRGCMAMTDRGSSVCAGTARGPVAESRLRRLEDGRYEYAPKHKAARTFVVTAQQLV